MQSSPGDGDLGVVGGWPKELVYWQSSFWIIHIYAIRPDPARPVLIKLCISTTTTKTTTTWMLASIHHASRAVAANAVRCGEVRRGEETQALSIHILKSRQLGSQELWLFGQFYGRPLATDDDFLSCISFLKIHRPSTGLSGDAFCCLLQETHWLGPEAK